MGCPCGCNESSGSGSISAGLRQILTSVGIDIGTSTTQLIFSKITIVNMANAISVPRIEILDTDVFYKSPIYFTPLINDLDIDADAVKKIVLDEYQKAGMTPDDINTGAVIITGESARKENANEVLEAMSDLAGNFVVATAGPDLESVLAAKGAGADWMSDENRTTICNLDVGGGTTNLAVFNRGQLEGTSCLDIGGRLIKVNNGRITYIFHKTEKLAKDHGLEMHVGDVADKDKIRKLCDIMARHLAVAIGIGAPDDEHNSLYTNDGRIINFKHAVQGVTFSGGVSDIVYNPVAGGDPFRYGDIGPILGDAINDCADFKRVKRYQSVETIRATVVGAGSHTTNVSGSTINYDKHTLPIKNVPIIRVKQEIEDDLELFEKTLQERIQVYESGNTGEIIGVGMSGKNYEHFDDIQALAKSILRGFKNYKNRPIVVVLENDIAKVLGNAIKAYMEEDQPLICIDSIFVRDGDYVDIGVPVASGHVVPVITKTLIFNH
ncbi:MAG: ethanolamine ammonia-lyase reactivating factor EutA [Mogibacterium sp.]|nr:ethanolamine ammonia-lyase reactivating factor EutA [Mogibacterium sp.]